MTLTTITIKKENLKNIKSDINIDLLDNGVQSNVILDAQKLIELPKDNGWRVTGFEKIPFKHISNKHIQ